MATGTATLDFGTGGSHATLRVADAGILSASRVEAWPSAQLAGGHSADEIAAEEFACYAGDIVNGVDFQIQVRPRIGRAVGQVKIDWAWL